MSKVTATKALPHLRNIAEKGYSPVRSPEMDEGAKLISLAGVGGVISAEVEFGLHPDVWKKERCKFALIPSSYFVQLLICHELSNQGF